MDIDENTIDIPSEMIAESKANDPVEEDTTNDECNDQIEKADTSRMMNIDEKIIDLCGDTDSDVEILEVKSVTKINETKVVDRRPRNILFSRDQQLAIMMRLEDRPRILVAEGAKLNWPIWSEQFPERQNCLRVNQFQIPQGYHPKPWL